MTQSDRKETPVLTEKQRRVIPFIVSASSLGDGCKAAGISRNTLYEWFKSPGFRDELQKAREQVVSDALDVLRQNVTRAVETLARLLGETESETLKRLVANDIIDHTLRAKELQDLEKRIIALEKAILEGSK
jgi:hypothetical protein